jgi:hypothetical protein
LLVDWLRRHFLMQHHFYPLFGSQWSMGHPWNYSVSLQLLNLGQSIGLLERVISLSQDLYLQRTTQT